MGLLVFKATMRLRITKLPIFRAHTNILMLDTAKEINHYEDVDIGGRLILSCVLEK
jgi:hypothetical protein